MELIAFLNTDFRNPWRIFMYYTEDSNILGGLASLLYAVYAVPALCGGKNEVPAWVRLFRFASTCCLTLTLLVVLFVLAPVSGFAAMLLNGHLLYMHLLCPLLAILSFLLLEDGSFLKKKHILYAVIPTLIYAMIAAVLNLLRIWYGPYAFLHLYEQSVFVSFLWFAVILGGTWGIGWLFLKANRAIGKKRS